MKTCKDCIHLEVCEAMHAEIMYMTGTFMGHSDNVDKNCRFFKDNTKLIELPCSIGDTIWCIPKCAVSPIDFEVMGGPALPIYHSLVDTFVSISDFGKIAFLTKEEAEKKLEEMKNEKE